MKIVAVMPVFGRHPLVKHTITRLLTKNGCTHVICAGEIKDREVCEKAGAIFIQHDNYPLGKKWNACFLHAKRIQADVVVFVGSSDWLCDNWIPTMLPYLEKYDMAGKAGCYLFDIAETYMTGLTLTKTYRLVYWPGYKDGSETKQSTNDRKNESIGIGRLIRKEGLDSINWKPFDDTQDNSLDWTMYNKLPNNVLVEDDSIFSMAISCNKWPNKHTFSAHWDNKYPSKRIDDLSFLKNFPEHDKIFQ